MLSIRSDGCRGRAVFTKIDLFGSSVRLTYKGEEKFSTPCSQASSVLVLTLYLILLGIKITEFVAQHDPLQFVSIQTQSMDQSLDLTALGFSFAVLAPEASLGRLEAHHVAWSAKDGVKRELELPLVACDTLRGLAI